MLVVECFPIPIPFDSLSALRPRIARLSCRRGMNTSDAPDSPPPDVAGIPVRSLGQAMDWSLVLASQAIESTIQRADAGWCLLVAPAESEAALAAIRLYQAENRGRPWRQEMFHTGFLFDWTSIGWAVAIASIFWLSTSSGNLRDAGIMDASAVSRGEWWRLFTAVWLHGDLGHLAMNLVIGLPLVGLAMGSCGSGTGFLAVLLAGAAGNVATLAFSFGPHRSLGASGLVMGALGLLAAQWLSLRGRTPMAKRLALGGLGGGFMLFALLGVSPGTDVVAHAGGFAGGLLFGAVLARRLDLARHAFTNVVTALAALGLTMITWWLALR
jgi:rhomboid protease GluP